MAGQDDGFISTSKLAKTLGMQTGAVFQQLQEMGLIEKAGDKWELTDAGKGRGGKYLSSKKYGTWIAWPKAGCDTAICIPRPCVHRPAPASSPAVTTIPTIWPVSPKVLLAI